MNYAQTLTEALSSNHLLKHPFYQAWSDGSLPRSSLLTYAAQYYHHVKAFPRYVSAAHSQCEDLQDRRLLLENLIDEERGDENHPELWARFADGLGIARSELESSRMNSATRSLIDTFLKLTRDSFESAMGALFAYEHQIPAIAEFKSDALEKHYGLADSRSHSFFEVHSKADIYHTQALSDVLEKLSPSGREKATAAAKEASLALWGFLDSMTVATAVA